MINASLSQFIMNGVPTLAFDADAMNARFVIHDAQTGRDLGVSFNCHGVFKSRLERAVAAFNAEMATVDLREMETVG